ncbi:MAG: RNA-binding protein [Melioribacteraceae bacterium]|nr:RNA-binding protein [Melioribacteraceae bacterium]
MKIYVENISSEVTELEIKNLFSKFGFVELIHISKYFDKYGAMAIIEMPEDKKALEAIEKLNGTKLSGRQITVYSSVMEGVE